MLKSFNALKATLPAAIAAAKERRVSTIDVLAQAEQCDAFEVLTGLSEQLGLSLLSPVELDKLACTPNVLTAAEAVELRVLESHVDGDPVIVLDDPWNERAAQMATERTGRRPRLLYTSPEPLRKKLCGLNGGTNSSVTPSRHQRPKVAGEPGNAVDFVDDAMRAAWTMHASDVHFESTRDGLIAKFRIDGVLSDGPTIAGSEIAAQVVSRLKVMAELDIAERRTPQDGRFAVPLDARPVDCRVSVMPSAYGEDVVVRVLDKRHLADERHSLTLESLGFEPEVRRRVDWLARRPHGMLLVTGPTGSGKTTTLYALLGQIRTGAEKIVTIEDPIEYDVPGVLQVPVNEKKGLTFARGLRSILRHDPDIIMVGEIRDRETADIAVQSALTGHLVLTTVHANSPFDVVSRFTHMGVDLYAFASCLNGVVSQRLLRLVCTRCAQADDDQTQALRRLRLASSSTVVRGLGCLSCRHTGFAGRTAVAEVLLVNDPMRDLLVSRAPLVTLRAAAEKSMGRSLTDAALDLVAQGRTTLQEVDRVVSLAA